MYDIDEKDLEYERRRKERMRRRMIERRRQMRRRRLMKLGMMAACFLLVVILAITGVVKLVTGGKNSKPKAKAAATVTKDTSQAIKQPLMGASDLAKMKKAGSVGWQNSENGYWYRNSDGSLYKNGWKEIDGAKYYFNDKGYIVTGWQEIEGKDYFFAESGKYDETKKRPMIALTFDDGPGQYTEDLLACLQENNAKATFFMQGINVEAYPEVAKKLKEAGMELGNHTYDHEILTNIDSSSVESELNKMDAALEAAAGVKTTVMRPPGGAYNETVQALTPAPIIIWSIDTLDWKTRDADNTYNVTVNNVTDGSVVLMHDIHEPSVEAAKRIIPELVSQGYKLVTISEMAEAKGIELKAGQPYFYFGEGEEQIE